MTRRELLARIDSAEITDWVAYDRIHASTTDSLLAQLCALVFNANRKEGARALSPGDFLPALKAEERARRDPRGVEKKLRAWAAMMSTKG